MRDRLLLALALLLLRALTPVGRVDALLALNRLVDGDLVADEENPAAPTAGEEEVGYESAYHISVG